MAVTSVARSACTNRTRPESQIARSNGLSALLPVPQLGASKPIGHKPVETHMLFGSFTGKAAVNLCRDTHHELS